MNTAPPAEVNVKPGTNSVQVNASPALPLSEKQRETWHYSKNIMEQMQQALARVDALGRQEGPLAAEMKKAADACARIMPIAGGQRIERPLPGTSIECPLPSIYLGKLLPATGTPDVQEGACNSIAGQGGVVAHEKEYQGECMTPLCEGADKLFGGGVGGQGIGKVPTTGVQATERTTPKPHTPARKKRVRGGRQKPSSAAAQGEKVDSLGLATEETADIDVDAVHGTSDAITSGLEHNSDAKKNTKNTKRGSIKYRGVTQHKNSLRYEAHIWVNQLKKQVYLGGYATEALAAEAYDILQVRLKGDKAKTNFPIENYAEVRKMIACMEVSEVVASVRREADTFSRGASRFRGVTKAATDSTIWESRIGTHGHGHIYIGVFEDDIVAAKAYDRALIRVKGLTTTTNFGISEYADAIEDYHWLQGLVKQGHQQAIALTTRDEPRYLRMFEAYVRGGMASLVELPEWSNADN